MLLARKLPRSWRATMARGSLFWRCRRQKPVPHLGLIPPITKPFLNLHSHRLIVCFCLMLWRNDSV